MRHTTDSIARPPVFIDQKSTRFSCFLQNGRQLTVLPWFMEKFFRKNAASKEVRESSMHQRPVMKRASEAECKAQLCANPWGQPWYKLWITFSEPLNVDKSPTLSPASPPPIPRIPRGFSHALDRAILCKNKHLRYLSTCQSHPKG